MTVQHSTITYKAVIGVLVVIVGFFCANLVTKLNDIQKDLVMLQLKVTELQLSLVSRADVREMIRDEVAKYHPRRPEP